MRVKSDDYTYGPDCLVCGALNPPGHVVVYDEKHTRREGKVCSQHTFWEVISHSSDRFMVEITMDPGPHPFTDALERVHARRGLMVATPKRKPRGSR